MIIKKAESDEEIKQCLEIRCKVFVEGQGVPIEDEVDDKDAESVHYLLFINGDPVGVTRVRFQDDFAKIERVAILPGHQGKGLGHSLMKFILSSLRSQSGLKKVKLSSQLYAIAFYEKLGFCVCSEEYLDAGILHKDMELLL